MKPVLAVFLGRRGADLVSIDISQVVGCCSVHCPGSCGRGIMMDGVNGRTYRCVVEARLVVLVADRLGLDIVVVVVVAPVEKSHFTTLQVVLINILAASYNIVVLRSGMIHHEQSCQWRNSSDALLMLKFWFWLLIWLNRTVHARDQSWLVLIIDRKSFEVVAKDLLVSRRQTRDRECDFRTMTGQAGNTKKQRRKREKEKNLPWWYLVRIPDVANLFLGELLVVPVRGVVALECFSDGFVFPAGEDARDDVGDLLGEIFAILGHV